MRARRRGGAWPRGSLATPRDDRLKLFATTTLLRFRRDAAGRSSSAAATSRSTVEGARRDHVFAFARALDGRGT